MHVVATAGHVDHGKSALIAALTGIEPDQWAAERRHGPAADRRMARLTLPSGAQLAFVDLPDHERFVPAMLCGAGPVPAVMFIVAADKGWMPQAAEQFAVLSALGIRHALLVVTKCDLADPAPVLADAATRMSGSPLAGIPTVTVSTATRAGIPELVAALDEMCARLPAPDPGAAVRIWIDRSVGSTGGGSVVTGTLQTGTVHKDDELLITPAMRPVRVRELRSLGTPADAATGTTRVALSLRGLGRDPLHRGMALVQPGRWTLTDVIDARIGPVTAPPADGGQADGQPAPETGVPGQLARSVTLHVGSARVTARVRPLGPGLVRLTLADPLPLHVGDRVLLRESVTRRPGSVPAVAGAVVLDVSPPPLIRRGAAAAAARQLAAWPDQPTAASLLARHGLLRGSVLLAMGVSELPEPVAGEWLADPDRWRALGHRLGEILASHAAAEPLAAGMPIEAAQAALDLPDRRLVMALAQPSFRISCGALQIGPSGGTAGQQLPEAVHAAIRVLRADLAAAPFASPDAGRLRKLGLDGRSIAAAVRVGELMRISDQVVLAPGADVAAAAILAALEPPFTAAQARQALGTTRRTAIPLLEFLDLAGITERLADDRRLVRTLPPPPAAAQDAAPPDAREAAPRAAAAAAASDV